MELRVAMTFVNGNPHYIKLLLFICFKKNKIIIIIRKAMWDTSLEAKKAQVIPTAFFTPALLFSYINNNNPSLPLTHQISHILYYKLSYL